MRNLCAFLAALFLATQAVAETAIQSQDLGDNLIVPGTMTAAGFKAATDGFELPDGTVLISTNDFVSGAEPYAPGGDLGGTGSAPVVQAINGVTVTGAPTVGQAIIATSPTAASWQNVSGGSGLPTTGGTMTGPIQMAGLQKVQFSTGTTPTAKNATVGFSTQPFGRLEIELPDTGLGAGALQLTSPSAGPILIFSTRTVPDMSDVAIIAFSTTNGMEMSSGNGGGGVELNDGSAVLVAGPNSVEIAPTRIDIMAPEIYLNPTQRLYIDASNFTSTGTGTHIGEPASGSIDLSGNQATMALDSSNTKFVANSSSANITATDINLNGSGGTTTIFAATLELGNTTTIHFGGTTNRTLCVNTSGNIFATVGACP